MAVSHRIFFQGPPKVSLDAELGPYVTELGGRKPIDVEHERMATREIVELRRARLEAIARQPAAKLRAAAAAIAGSSGSSFVMLAGPREALELLQQLRAGGSPTKLARRLEELDRGSDIARRLELELGSAEVTAAGVAYRKARDAFARLNLRLVVNIAMRYSGLTLADRVQEGNIGLVTAVERFEPQRGLRFSTYAVWWIRFGISRAIENTGRMIRVPANLQSLGIRRLKAGELLQDLDDDAIDDLFAAERGIHKRVVANARRSMSMRVVDSDDAQRGDFGQTRQPRGDLTDPQAAPDEALQQRSDTELVLRALAQLPSDRDRLILTARFGIGCESQTLDEIAGRIGCSRERVRQLETIAMDRLQRVLGPKLDKPVHKVKCRHRPPVVKR